MIIINIDKRPPIRSNARQSTLQWLQSSVKYHEEGLAEATACGRQFDIKAQNEFLRAARQRLARYLRKTTG